MDKQINVSIFGLAYGNSPEVDIDNIPGLIKRDGIFGQDVEVVYDVDLTKLPQTVKQLRIKIVESN